MFMKVMSRQSQVIQILTLKALKLTLGIQSLIAALIVLAVIVIVVVIGGIIGFCITEICDTDNNNYCIFIVV